jgi:hypothetical protein
MIADLRFTTVGLRSYVIILTPINGVDYPFRPFTYSDSKYLFPKTKEEVLNMRKWEVFLSPKMREARRLTAESFVSQDLDSPETKRLFDFFDGLTSEEKDEFNKTFQITYVI